MGNQRTANTNAAAKPLSDTEKLRLGESVWLHGCLVASTDGLLTLEAQGTQMIVRADDVRSKDELEGQTLLEVSPEANVLVRTESLLRADSGQCNSPAGSGEPGIAPPEMPGPRLDDETFPDLFFPYYRCRWYWTYVFVCRWVVIRCIPRRICYPEYRRRVICWHEGAV
jgi:hypothetical protein